MCILALASASLSAGGHGGHHGGGGHGHGFHHGHGGHHINAGFFFGPSFGYGYGYGYNPYWGYPYYPYYSYPPTVVTVPTRPPVYVEREPAQSAEKSEGFWYYCKDPEGYYPYVRECHHAWRPVPARPQNAP